MSSMLQTSCATAVGGIALRGISFGCHVSVVHDDRWTSLLAQKVGECIPSVAHVGFNVHRHTSREYDDLNAIIWYSVGRGHSDGSQRAEPLSWWKAEQLVAELLSLGTDHSQ